MHGFFKGMGLSVRAFSWGSMVIVDHSGIWCLMGAAGPFQGLSALTAAQTHSRHWVALIAFIEDCKSILALPCVLPGVHYQNVQGHV